MDKSQSLMNNSYDFLTIKQYIEGRLDAQRSHQLEKDALADPLLQEAIDGFSQKHHASEAALESLQHKLSARIDHQQQQRNHFFFGRQRLAIASLAGVLFLLATLLFWMINFPLERRSAQPAEISLQSLNSLQASPSAGDLRPEIGWEAYVHYLSLGNSSALQPGEETVLSFTVVDGEARNIEIVKSNSSAQAEALKQLILKGPKWQGSEGTIRIWAAEQ